MAHLKVSARVLGTELGIPAQQDPLVAELGDLAHTIAEHAAFEHIMRYLGHAKSLGLDLGDPENIRRAVKAGETACVAEQHDQQASETYATFARVDDKDRHPPLVYYMRIESLVKIGTTTRLARRFGVIMPHGIMAIEPGGEVRERARHHEFAVQREKGEWFKLNAKLASHIADLRERFEHETGESTEAWLERHTATPGRVRPRRARSAGPRKVFTAVALPGATLPYDAAELVPACLAAKAVGISPSLFNLWRRKGKISPVAQTSEGRRLYRIAEVQAVPRRQFRAR